MPTSSAHAGKAGSKSKTTSAPPKPASTKAAAPGPSPAVMPTYARQNVVFERGEGAWLIAKNGDRYLDFGSGVAVNALATTPSWGGADREGAKLGHSYNPTASKQEAGRAAGQVTFAEQAFFVSGARLAKAPSRRPP